MYGIGIGCFSIVGAALQYPSMAVAMGSTDESGNGDFVGLNLSMVGVGAALFGGVLQVETC